MFYKGQKVVCVDAKPRVENICPLREGAIYTVSVVRDRTSFGMTLDVIESPSPSGRCYYADRFRPAVEKKTDISVFEEILRKASKQIPAQAGLATSRA